MADAGPVFDATNPCSPLSVPPSSTALLLCDFHNLLVSTMPPEGPAAATRAAALRTWARSQNMPVVHCLIDLAGPTPPAAKIASSTAQIRARAAASGDPEFAAEVPELRPTADEYTFWRPLGCLSATSSYGLTDFLARRGVRSVVVAGVATSGCVIDTAKECAERGLVVSVVEDACADRSVETHEFVVRRLLGRQCHVATLDVFVEAWK